MPIQIKAPDGSIAQFPDGTPDATIEHVMAQAYPHPGPQKDMGGGLADPSAVQAMGVAPRRPLNLGESISDFVQSGGAGLMQGASQAVGTVGDLRNAAHAGLNKALDLEAQAFGIAPDKVAAYKKALEQTSAAVRPFNPYVAGIDRAPTGAQVNAARQSVMGPDYQPKGVAGDYGRTIGQFAPAALMPGGVGARLANVIVPGALSETAGQLTKGTPYEGPARLVGGMLGGLGVAGAQHVMASPERAFAPTAQALSADESDAAVQMMRDAQARGVQITPAEAIQQVMNGAAPSASRLQRVIEGTREGQARLGPIMAARPQQTYRAVQSFADTLAPATDNPSMIGQDVQQAATGALDQARQGVNSQTDHLYKALTAETLPPEAYAQVSANPRYALALKELRENPITAPEIAGLPDNSVHVVNEVVKRLGSLGESAQAGGDNYVASLHFGAKGAADQAARAVSDNYGAARDATASLSRAQVDPLKAGPLGTFSATGEVPAQTAAAFPANPLAGAPAETRTALNTIGQDNAAALTRQHLLRTLNESSQGLQGGANQFGGAKYAAVIAGNPEQAATLKAGLDVAKPGSSAEHDALLEILQATGRREPVGSQTAFNAEALKGLKELPIPAQGLNPVKIPGLAYDALKNLNFKRNAKALADFLSSSPDEAAAFIAASKRAGPGGSVLANALVDARASRK